MLLYGLWELLSYLLSPPDPSSRLLWILEDRFKGIIERGFCRIYMGIIVGVVRGCYYRDYGLFKVSWFRFYRPQGFDTLRLYGSCSDLV